LTTEKSGGKSGGGGGGEGGVHFRARKEKKKKERRKKKDRPIDLVHRFKGIRKKIRQLNLEKEKRGKKMLRAA